MIESRFNNIKIAAVATAVSNQWVSLEEIAGDEDAAAVAKRKRKTGINGKYVAQEKQTTSDFAYAAACEIFEKKQIDKNEVGILILVTQCPDYDNPATACVLQHRLGLPEDCIAFDINLGCSGYVYGLNVAAALLANSTAKKALLLAGDTPAKGKNASERMNLSNTHKFIFGDAGTATLLEKEDGNELFTGMRTDGSGFKAIIKPYGQWRHPDEEVKKVLDDVEVFNFSISKVPEMINEFLEKNQETAADYDYMVLHQANLMMMKQIAKRTGFEPEKNLISLDDFGNTSSASIPATLVKHFGELEETRKIRFLMSGFGIGLSWGIATAEIDVQDILPLVHTDEYFDDGL